MAAKSTEVAGAFTQEPSMAPASDREIVLTREFDAPRELVFRAYTEPQHMQRWWGPRGFTITTRIADMHPGGTWRFVMHGPDGTDFENRIIWTEIVRPERLEWVHDDGTDSDAQRFNVTVTFVEKAGKTQVTMRSVFASAEACNAVKAFGAVELGKQTLECLGEHLATMALEPEFTITRTFDAPRELVWKAFAEADRLARWWGPKGFDITVKKLDFVPGGTFHYVMRNASGMEMWGKFAYWEISAPERIVFINSFSDPQGNIVRGPFSPDLPLEIYNWMTLTEQGGKTTLTLRGAPINATAAERAWHASMYASMRQGFGGTFDQLEAYLAECLA